LASSIVEKVCVGDVRQLPGNDGIAAVPPISIAKGVKGSIAWAVTTYNVG
jgi:hypothetical protein